MFIQILLMRVKKRMSAVQMMCVFMLILIMICPYILLAVQAEQFIINGWLRIPLTQI